MAKIHMEPWLVRDLSRRMDRTAGELYHQGRRLDQAAARLPQVWQGGRSSSHQRDFRNFLRAYHAAVEELQNLAVRLGREADQWEMTDQDTKFNLGAVAVPGILTAGGLVFAAGGYNQGSAVLAPWSRPGGLPPFNWGTWGRDWGKDLAEDAWQLTDDLRYTDYRSIGRFFNRMAGSERAGWVGRWDDLGHFLRNPIISKGVVPSGINSIFGVLEGESWSQAIVSGSLEAGMKYGMRLIPFVGTALLISDIIQLGGSLAGAGLELVGAHGAASLVQNSLEVIDLGGYVEDISDGIADLLLPPWNEPPNFSELGERLDTSSRVAYQIGVL